MENLIVTSDWHLRMDRPICRIDEDWLGSQKQTMLEIQENCKKHHADLVVVGDLFDAGLTDNRLVNAFLQIFQGQKIKVFIIDGNHDVQYHNWKNKDKSSFGILWEMAKEKESFLYHLYSLGYAKHFDEKKEYQMQKMVFLHELTLPSFTKHNLFRYNTPKKLVERFNGARYIFTGDNHEGFYEKVNGVHVINMGCINIQSAKLANYYPSVWLIEKGIEKPKRIKLDKQEENLNFEYLEFAKKRDNRIENFVRNVKEMKGLKFDYIENIKDYIKNNQIERKVEDVISETINYIKRG